MVYGRSTPWRAQMKSTGKKISSALIGMAVLFIMASPLSADPGDPPEIIDKPAPSEEGGHIMIVEFVARS